ncbi:MAG: hypothetical protein FWD17_07535, partial [Polyangiaceae bacterium]|nr:hypothetical protein [Polyangiaceae bacterium]
MKRRQRDERIGIRCAGMGAHVFDLGRVLSCERFGDRGLRLGRKRREQRANDPRVTDVDLESTEAGRNEPVAREREQLEVAVGAGNAGELHPDLRNLPVLSGSPAPPAQHRSLVPEAERERPAPEARRNHARDLRRHVGPERGDLARLGLDEAKDVGRIERAEPPLENLGKFEDGRRHDRVAVQGKAIEQATGQPAARRGFFRKEVAHALRQRVLERPRRCFDGHTMKSLLVSHRAAPVNWRERTGLAAARASRGRIAFGAPTSMPPPAPVADPTAPSRRFFNDSVVRRRGTAVAIEPLVATFCFLFRCAWPGVAATLTPGQSHGLHDRQVDTR